MKRFFSQVIPLSFLFFALIGTSAYAQNIDEAEKKAYEEVLKKNPRDFEANFQLGAFYHQLALDPPNATTTRMKLTENMEPDEAFEKKKNDNLKRALHYFENAYVIGKDSNPRVKSSLKSIYQHLGMLPVSRVSPDEVEARLREKLSKIQFKSVN
jgi:hypothetical protein